MPRSAGTDLSPELREILDGEELAGREGMTFLLITAAGDGWPHVAMLSVGEVLARDERQLRFALWPGSQTTENLTRERETAVLMIVHAGSVYYLRLRCHRLADAKVKGMPRALFSAQVEEVLQDVVDYAVITNGIRFRLKKPKEVLEVWTDSVRVMRETDLEPG